MSNFYDLLGVDRTASADEIRAAWKAAIADLDPTDPIFRAYSGAAEVLLDVERRAAYDADLAPAEESVAETPVADDPVADEPAEPVAEESVAETPVADEPAQPVADEPAEPVAEEPAEPVVVDPVAATTSSGPAGWLLGAVGAAAVLALVLAIFLLAQPGGRLGGDSPREVADRNAAAEAATLSAEGAAERMVPEILSYDYRTLDADFARRNAHLTPQLQEKTDALWEQLREDAVTNKLQVSTTTEAAGLTRLSEDTLKAVVVVFFRQDITSNAGDVQQDSRWATFNLVREDADAQEWLVDDVCVDSGCE